MSMRRVRRFFRYYCWHIIFALLVAMCVIFVFRGLTKKETADLRIVYAAEKYMNAQSFNDGKEELELLVRDANKDDKRVASITVNMGNDEEDSVENLKEATEADSYDIYISTRAAFEAVEDKSVFAPVDDYYNTSIDTHIQYLTDGDGAAYAASLKDNSLAEALGITNADELYIAAAALGDDASLYRKNGVNITGYILENKYKYNN